MSRDRIHWIIYKTYFIELIILGTWSFIFLYVEYSELSSGNPISVGPPIKYSLFFIVIYFFESMLSYSAWFIDLSLALEIINKKPSKLFEFWGLKYTDNEFFNYIFITPIFREFNC